MLSALAAAALLASPALAEESGVHLGLGPQAGTAYNGIGLQLHLRVSHFAGYIGAGVLGFWEQGIFQRAEQSYLRVSGGVRWFPGETFFLSLNATKAGFDYHYDPGLRTSRPMRVDYFALTTTLGGRWRMGPMFFEASFGGGLSWTVDPGTGSTGAPPPGTVPTTSIAPIPDFSFGLCFEI
jgi:hypothetical protein